MAQWIKALAAKPYDLKLITGTHMVKGKAQLQKVYTHAHGCSHTVHGTAPMSTTHSGGLSRSVNIPVRIEGLTSPTSS